MARSGHSRDMYSKRRFSIHVPGSCVEKWKNSAIFEEARWEISGTLRGSGRLSRLRRKSCPSPLPLSPMRGCGLRSKVLAGRGVGDLRVNEYQLERLSPPHARPLGMTREGQVSDPLAPSSFMGGWRAIRRMRCVRASGPRACGPWVEENARSAGLGLREHRGRGRPRTSGRAVRAPWGRPRTSGRAVRAPSRQRFSRCATAATIAPVISISTP
jgi:hypothetical protein